MRRLAKKERRELPGYTVALTFRPESAPWATRMLPTPPDEAMQLTKPAARVHGARGHVRLVAGGSGFGKG